MVVRRSRGFRRSSQSFDTPWAPPLKRLPIPMMATGSGGSRLPVDRAVGCGILFWCDAHRATRALQMRFKGDPESQFIKTSHYRLGDYLKSGNAWQGNSSDPLRNLEAKTQGRNAIVLFPVRACFIIPRKGSSTYTPTRLMK